MVKISKKLYGVSLKCGNAAGSAVEWTKQVAMQFCKGLERVFVFLTPIESHLNDFELKERAFGK